MKFVLTIEFDPEKRLLHVNAPPDQIMAYGMLEKAKDVVRGQGAPPAAKSMIEIPTMHVRPNGQ